MLSCHLPSTLRGRCLLPRPQHFPASSPKGIVSVGPGIPTEQPGSCPNHSRIAETPVANGLMMLASTGRHLLFFSYHWGDAGLFCHPDYHDDHQITYTIFSHNFSTWKIISNFLWLFCGVTEEAVWSFFNWGGIWRPEEIRFVPVFPLNQYQSLNQDLVFF